MRTRAITSEALRNLATGTTRAAMLAVVLAVIVGGLAWVDVRTAVDVLRGADAYRASGSAVHVLEAQQGIDGARCEALNRVAGVEGAGALRQGEGVRAAAMPSSGLNVWDVTPGLIDVIAGTGTRVDTDGHRAGGMWYSTDLAETLGARPGRVLATSAGDAATAGVYSWPDDGRARTLGYAALTPVAPQGAFDQCWMHVWPLDEGAASLIYTALDPAKADVATLGRLNSARGTSYDVVGQLDGRMTRQAPAAAAAFGLVLGYAAMRMRRLELASALHSRVRPAHLAWQHVLEALAWVIAGSCLAAAAVAYAATVGNPDPSGYALGIGARTVVAGAAAVLLGTLIGVLATRERHLFRYFKDR